MMMQVKGAVALGLAAVAVVGTGAVLLLSEAPERPASPRQVVAAERNAAATPTPPADERFVIKRILPISGPIKYGEWHWDEADVPAGPIVVTVDLENIADKSHRSPGWGIDGPGRSVTLRYQFKF